LEAHLTAKPVRNSELDLHTLRSVLSIGLLSVYLIEAFDLTWLVLAISLIYFGFDAYHRFSLASKPTGVSKSMIIVGVVFLALAVEQIHQDILMPLVHIVPVIVLLYAAYEYRKLIRESAVG
jgi:multisubunit Na+/H+ antiporter MnhG subunit